MARISGLASEHHAVGPGDAPRRRKGRVNNTPDANPSQGSKRAISPSAEEVSMTKRTRVEQDVFAQEGGAVSPSEELLRVTKQTTTVRARRASEPLGAAEEDEMDSQMTHQSPPTSTAPLPGLTPHLQRVGAPRARAPKAVARRARMSMPAYMHLDRVQEIEAGEIQYAPFKATIDSRTRRRLKRNHFAEEYNSIEADQKEDRKARKALIELRRELREKDQTIKDLEFKLESGRLGDINMTAAETEELRQHLAKAQQEIDDLRASTLYRGDNSRETSTFSGNMDGLYDDDDEPFLAIDPNDPDGPEDDMSIDPLPTGEFAARALALSSQVTVGSLATIAQTTHDALADEDPESLPDKISDKAVKRYEAEIESLTESLAEAQGALRVIAIELQNLHVLQPGASSDVLIATLRHGFESVREQLENLLPGETKGITNSELLNKIPSLLEGVLAELHEKVTVAQAHYETARTMRAQFENALDIIERSDTRNEELEAQNEELEAKVEDFEHSDKEKQTAIIELEERVKTLDTVVNDQENEIQDKDAQIRSFTEQVEDKDTALERFRDTLDQYRNDLNSVTETATRLEEEHRQKIADMDQKHADEVAELHIQLQEEAEGRFRAEGEAEQKSEFIDNLQDELQRIEAQVDGFIGDIGELRNRLAAEQEDHAKTQANLEDERNQVYDHANRIENLEEELEQLKASLADAQSNLEAEQSQRADAEASLEEANQEISDLNTRIHDAGLQANELRSKLFQVQLEKEEAITNLQETAQEHEIDLQSNLDEEAHARQEAEQIIAQRDSEIVELETQIAARTAEVERLVVERRNLESDRDAQVTHLSMQLADLQQKYRALESNSNSTITSLQANITDLTNDLNAYKSEYERVKTEAAEMEDELRNELAGKEAEIQELQDTLGESRADFEKLDKEHKDSIESFSEESNQFFKMQDKFVREANALKMQNENLQDRMRQLEEANAERLAAHEAQLLEKVTEIEELHMLGDARAEHIVALQAQMDTMKAEFETAEQDNRDTIDALTESQRQLQEKNEEMAAALKKRNADRLQAVRDMRVEGIHIRGKSVDLRKVAAGKITKVNERVKVGKKGRKVKDRAWRDSGFGVDSDIENGVDEEEASAFGGGEMENEAIAA